MPGVKIRPDLLRPPSVPLSAAIERLCAEVGLRKGRGTRRVLGAVIAASGPVTIRDLIEVFEDDGGPVALPTVYAVLQALVDADVLLHHRASRRFSHYHLRPDLRARIERDLCAPGSAERDELQALLIKTAAELGYRLVYFQLSLFGHSMGEIGDQDTPAEIPLVFGS